MSAKELINELKIKEILRDLEFASGVFDYTITPHRCTFLKDYIINLQQENKQLKEEKPYLYTNTAWEDILEYQGKPYIELDRFKTIQQENKKLKEQKKQAIENIKTIKQHYEELKKAPFEDSVFINDMLRQSFITSIEGYFQNLLDTIQELKEKYK